MDNVTYEGLKKTHKENAADVFHQVRILGGFGDVPLNFEGGLDVAGLPEGANKEKILNLLGTKAKGDK